MAHETLHRVSISLNPEHVDVLRDLWLSCIRETNTPRLSFDAFLAGTASFAVAYLCVEHATARAAYVRKYNAKAVV